MLTERYTKSTTKRTKENDIINNSNNNVNKLYKNRPINSLTSTKQFIEYQNTIIPTTSETIMDLIRTRNVHNSKNSEAGIYKNKINRHKCSV